MENMVKSKAGKREIAASGRAPPACAVDAYAAISRPEDVIEKLYNYGRSIMSLSWLFGRNKKDKPKENNQTSANTPESNSDRSDEKPNSTFDIDKAFRNAHQLWLDKKYEESLTLYDRILANLPDSSNARFTVRERRAMVLCRLGRFDEAEHELEDIIATVERYAGPLSKSATIFYWLSVAKLRDEGKARAAEWKDIGL
jgi:tetratricopeptide (TPR) repeat protein